MNIVQLISHKRDGSVLQDHEIRWMIDQFARDEISPEQMSAMAMAIYFQGMSPQETRCLTQAMIDSGRPLVKPSGGRPRLDKHSTGGIGDKISLPLAPLLSVLGIDVPMISGRGLGPTGGTLDKLESIPGFQVEIPPEEIQRQLDDHGCVIASASSQLAPADKKLYALRDVTGTVPSIPLITGSILSKKLSEGLDGLVMDVKWGSGAFMKTLDDAKRLAHSLVRVATELGVPTVACLTDMNQPLGRMVGNACEVVESIDVLQGSGPADVRHLTCELAAQALLLLGLQKDHDRAFQLSAEHLDNGSAWKCFQKMVAGQGGRLEDLNTDFQRYPLLSPTSGWVTGMETENLGFAVIEMGGGRKQRNDPLDYQVGLEVLVRPGQQVEAGQPWVNVLNYQPQASQTVTNLLQESLRIGETAPAPKPLITEIVGR